MANETLSLGAITAEAIGSRRETATSTSRFTGDVEVTVYEVRGPGFRLEVGDYHFFNHDRDLRVASRCDSPEPWDRLVRGFRVGVEHHRGERFKMRVRIPALGVKPYPTLRQTSLEELAEACDLDPESSLVQLGAKGLGPASRVLGEKGRMRNELYVAFDDPDHMSLVPIATFVLSPVTTYWKKFILT